jgi:hypothetical protein
LFKKISDPAENKVKITRKIKPTRQHRDSLGGINEANWSRVSQGGNIYSIVGLSE